MKDETAPIEPIELLYRRVYKDKFRSDRLPYISPKAFEPRIGGRDPDNDGISLFRADCLSGPEQLLAAIPDPDKRAANGIVAISVAEMRALNLSVVSTPRDDIPGHVSIPEMSASAMRHPDTEEQCRRWMNELAAIASRDDRIVREPTIH